MADRTTKLHNLCKGMKVEFPEISFETITITGTHGGRSIWRGKSNFLGKVFVGEGSKKPDAKTDVCDQVLRGFEEGKFGEQLRAQALQVSKFYSLIASWNNFCFSCLSLLRFSLKRKGEEGK